MQTGQNVRWHFRNSKAFQCPWCLLIFDPGIAWWLDTANGSRRDLFCENNKPSGAFIWRHLATETEQKKWNITAKRSSEFSPGAVWLLGQNPLGKQSEERVIFLKAIIVVWPLGHWMPRKFCPVYLFTARSKLSRLWNTGIICSRGAKGSVAHRQLPYSHYFYVEYLNFTVLWSGPGWTIAADRDNSICTYKVI